MAEMQANEHFDVLERLRFSDDPGDRDFALYVERLEGSVDLQKYGRRARENDGGVLTRCGYLIPDPAGLPERYTCKQDIPREHLVTVWQETPERRPSLLAALKAAKAASRAADAARPDTPERKTPSGPEL